MQGGEPLSQPLRDFYEPRLGSDLTAVRVHRDAEAGEVARSIGARAFAVGDHVAVAPHHWSPDTWQGRRLIAHELAHVRQRNAETLRRDDEAPPAPEDTVDWVAALRTRLEDERNEAALDVIGAMNRTQADQVLADPVIRALAVKAFDKDEMGSADSEPEWRGDTESATAVCR